MDRTRNGPTELAAWFTEAPASVAGITIVATDVDGTLTREGEITAEVVELCEHLDRCGIEVLPVSGRAAGEVAGLARYLPGVRRAIAENGLLLVEPDVPLRWLSGFVPDVVALRAIGEQLNAELGLGLRLAPDAAWRLGDVAYERDGRSDAELARIARLVRDRGAWATWSSVHVHFGAVRPDKGKALARVLAEDGRSPENTVVIGDAPNDAGMFALPGVVSVGTADVLEHLAAYPDAFPIPPRYVTRGRESDGFAQLARGLIRLRTSQG
jgi:hydroxymethylpyrimidine pyrophosphatase-like HAD family hydrolase